MGRKAAYRRVGVRACRREKAMGIRHAGYVSGSRLLDTFSGQTSALTKRASSDSHAPKRLPSSRSCLRKLESLIRGHSRPFAVDVLVEHSFAHCVTPIRPYADTPTRFFLSSLTISRPSRPG